MTGTDQQWNGQEFKCKQIIENKRWRRTKRRKEVWSNNLTEAFIWKRNHLTLTGLGGLIVLLINDFSSTTENVGVCLNIYMQDSGWVVFYLKWLFPTVSLSCLSFFFSDGFSLRFSFSTQTCQQIFIQHKELAGCCDCPWQWHGYTQGWDWLAMMITWPKNCQRWLQT